MSSSLSLCLSVLPEDNYTEGGYFNHWLPILNCEYLHFVMAKAPQINVRKCLTLGIHITGVVSLYLFSLGFVLLIFLLVFFILGI